MFYFARIAPLFLLLVILPVVGATEDRWVSNGPFGGDFGFYVFHPSDPKVIYAGKRHGYKSTDSGLSWKRMDLRDEILTFRVHPKDPDGIVALSFFAYRSNNRGETFEKISTQDRPFGCKPIIDPKTFRLKNEDCVFDMEFDPENPQLLYAATSQGVFKSENGGVTWSNTSAGINDLFQIEVNPDNGQELYILQRGGKIFRSSNGGGSWQQVANPGIVGRGLAIDPGNPSVLYVSGNDGIVRTENKGDSWSNLNCGCDVRELAVDPKNSSNLYAVGDDVVRSTNGGSSWGKMNIPRLPDTLFLGIAVHTLSNNQVYTGGQREGIFRSSDFGSTWKKIIKGLDGLSVKQFASSEAKPANIYSRASDAPYFTFNGAKTWDISKTNPLQVIQSIAVHPANPNLVVMTGRFGVAVSTDGGKNFKRNEPSLDGRQIALNPSNQNLVYAGAAGGGQFFRSEDQGKNFAIHNAGLGGKTITVIRVHPSNFSTLLVGTADGKVFRSSNNGTSWQSSSSGLKIASVASIAFDSTNPQRVYAAGQKGFFRSTNGGSSWKKVTKGLPSGFPLNFVFIDPENSQRIFTGGFGIFVSLDGGSTWSNFDTRGLIDDAFVYDFLILKSVPDSYFAATQRGVFKLTQHAPPGAPQIEETAPGNGKPGDSATVHGSNFGNSVNDVNVTFGNVPAQVDSVSNNTIRLKVPPGSKTGAVTIKKLKQKSNTFEFLVRCTGEPLCPSSGPRGGGQQITLIDSSDVSKSPNFNVLFGSKIASDCRLTPPDIIICTVPPGDQSGQVEVSVQNYIITVILGTYTYQ